MFEHIAISPDGRYTAFYLDETAGLVAGGGGGTDLSDVAAGALERLDDQHYCHSFSNDGSTAFPISAILVPGNSGGADTNAVDFHFNAASEGAVTITGSVRVGETVTADSTSVTDEDRLGAFGYQWRLDGVAISGATNTSFTLLDAHTDADLSVNVTWTDGGGTGDDVLTGGAEADLFLFKTGYGTDTVTDFDAKGRVQTPSTSPKSTRSSPEATCLIITSTLLATTSSSTRAAATC